MEKQIRDFKVSYSLDWQYGVAISKIREDLDELEKLGVTHIEIEIQSEYGSSYVKIEPISKRIETDEEYNKRIGDIEKRNEDQKRRDLEQLAKLKSKYGL